MGKTGADSLGPGRKRRGGDGVGGQGWGSGRSWSFRRWPFLAGESLLAVVRSVDEYPKLCRTIAGSKLYLYRAFINTSRRKQLFEWFPWVPCEQSVPSNSVSFLVIFMKARH